jgi:hypothetical protein
MVTGVRRGPETGDIVTAGGGEEDVLPPVIVSAAVPGMEVVGSVAVMVTTPVATPVASPVELTMAVPGVDDVHVTLSVRFLVVRLEYVPVVVNCWV